MFWTDFLGSSGSCMTCLGHRCVVDFVDLNAVIGPQSRQLMTVVNVTLY